MCHDFARKIPVLNNEWTGDENQVICFSPFIVLYIATPHTWPAVQAVSSGARMFCSRKRHGETRKEKRKWGESKGAGRGRGVGREREEKTKRALYQNKVNFSLTFTRNLMPYTHVWKRVRFDAFKPSVDTNTLSVFIKNASILKRSWKRIKTKTHTHHTSLDSRKRFKTVVWTRNDRCVFDDNENAYFWKRISVDRVIRVITLWLTTVKWSIVRACARVSHALYI